MQDGFYFGGIWILDRTKSPCGRFDLTPDEADNLYGKEGHRKMRMEDFQDLDRNANGDIINLYAWHHLLTDKQVEQLTEDDWSRYHEYQEELDILYQQAKEEFGV